MKKIKVLSLDEVGTVTAARLDGLDEISVAASTHVAETRQGEVAEYDLSPEDLGVAYASIEGLEVANSDESLALIRSALSGAPGDTAVRARQVIALNAGAALYVAGLAPSLEKGVAQASTLLESGKPWSRVEALVDLTASF